jgi:hypothetical protein
MKRNLFLLVILLNVFHNIYTQEVVENVFEFKFNYGNFGGGINIFKNEYGFELSAGLINFFIEHDKTNIGFEVSPLRYIANYSVNTRKWDQNLYFINGNLYWNPFDIENIILGPFISINYLGIDNWSKFNINRYVFDSGLRFLLGTHIGKWNYPFQIIGSEVGYRNISGKHSFYFNINLDISILVWFIASILREEGKDVIEANEDYEKLPKEGPFIPKEPKQPQIPFQRDIEPK